MVANFRCSAGICRTVRAASISLPRRKASDSFDVMPTMAQERRDERTREQTVMDRRLVQIGGHGDRKDRLQMRRPLDRGFELRHREIADPDHADIAVAPGLRRRPFDQVVHVAAFLRVEKAEGAARTAGAAQVGDHMDVAARDEEVAGARLDESHRRTEILDLPRIGRRCDQHRIAAGLGRPMHVRQQRDAVAHRDRDIVVARHRALRLGEIAIAAAGGLRTVELTLAGFGSCNRGAAIDVPAIDCARPLHALVFRFRNTTKWEIEKLTRKLTPMARSFAYSTGMTSAQSTRVVVAAINPSTCEATKPR